MQAKTIAIARIACFIKSPDKCVSFERAVGLAPADHLLAVFVEGVVKDPMGGVESVIVLETQMPKSMGDGVEERGFGLVLEGVVGVRGVEDLGEGNECSVV